MHASVIRFALALLLAIVLPLEGHATASMMRCLHGSAQTATGAGSSDPACHEGSIGSRDGDAQHGAPADHAGGCNGCAQCVPCFANALPATARTIVPMPRPHLSFPAPALSTGFIPEHLDPPPLG